MNIDSVSVLAVTNGTNTSPLRIECHILSKKINEFMRWAALFYCGTP